MAVSNSLILIGSMKNKQNEPYSGRGFVDDNGLSITPNGATSTSVGDIPTDVVANRKKKTSIFEAMEILESKNKEIGSQIEEPFYNVDISTFKYGKYHYDRDMVEEYYNRMNGIESYRHAKGNTPIDNSDISAIFSYDIEITGQHPDLPPMNGADNLDINTRHYSITEASIWRHYRDDKGDWVREKVSGFTSRPDILDVDGLLHARKSDQTTMVTLQRIAGYSGDAIDEFGNIKYHDGKADVSDRRVIKAGASNMERIKTVRNLSDPKLKIEYIKSFEENVLIPLDIISKNKNGVLASMNGKAFDSEHIMAEVKALGLYEKYKHIFDYEFDTQAIQMQFISDIKYELMRKYGLDENLKLENLNKITLDDPKIKEQVDKIFGKATSHNADYDTYMTGIESFVTWIQSKDRIKEYIDISAKKMDTGDDTIYVSNGAFKSNDSSLHFRVVGGEVDTFNSYITKRDAAYKLKVFGISSKEDIKKLIGSNEGINSQMLDAIGNVENKIMIELNNILEDESAYLFFNNIEDAQESLIDSQLLEKHEKNDDLLTMLKQSLEEQTIDKQRKMLDGYGSLTSWNKVDRLEKMLTQHDVLMNYKVEGTDELLVDVIDDDGIKNLLNGESISVHTTIGDVEVAPEKVFTEFLYNDKNSGTPKVSRSNLKTYSLMFEDLKLNSSTYKEVLYRSKNAVDSKYISSYSEKINTSRIFKEFDIDNITSIYGGVMKDVENSILDNLTEYQKLKYIVDHDPYMKDIYDNEIEVISRDSVIKEWVESLSGKRGKERKKIKGDVLPKNSKVNLSEKDDLNLLKRVYYRKHRKSFDEHSNTAINLLKGRKELTGRNIATSIDIIDTNFEYTNVSFKTKKQFTDAISRKVYSIDRYSDNANLKVRNQTLYIDDIAENLESRGLLTKESLKEVKSSKSVGPKIELLTDELFSAKEKAHGYIKKAIGSEDVVSAMSKGWEGVKEVYNPDKLTQEEFDFAVQFIENRVMESKYSGTTNTIAGKSITKHLEELKAKNVFNLEESVRVSSERNSSNFDFLGSIKYVDDEVINELFDQMYIDLGWNNNPSNIEAFKKLLKSEDFNREITLKGQDKPIGVSKLFYNVDGDYYMIATHNERVTRQLIQGGATIDDLKKNSIVYKMPKVEMESMPIQGNDIHLKFISQSETQKKLVSDDISIKIKGGVFTYDMLDTTDMVLGSLTSDFKHALAFMEERDYESANKRVKDGFQKVNESKTLGGIVDRYVLNNNGEMVIKSVYSPTIADMSKSYLVNRTALMYEFDTVMSANPELKERLIKYLDSQKEANKLIKYVKDHKVEVQKKSSKIISTLDEMHTEGFKINTFMMNNINEYADTLLNNADFKGRASVRVISHLQELKEFGHLMVSGKESDVERGYSSIINLHNTVPFSDYSNPLRNTQFQSLGGYSIFEDSMLLTAKNTPFKDDIEIKTIDDVYKALNIKPGNGIDTPLVSDFADYKYNKDGSLTSLTVRAQHLTSEEYNKKVKDVYEKSEIHEEIRKKILKDFGVSNITKEEIEYAAKVISQSASLYEDGGSINIMLAENLFPRTVFKRSVHEINNELKLGQEIKAGDLLGFDEFGKKIFYNEEKAIIKNLDNGQVYLQLDEFYSNVKIITGRSEKAVYAAPRFKRGTEEYNKRMTRLIATVQNYITNDAAIAFNPGVVGHGASNTVLNPYVNAVADLITSEKDLLLANTVFDEVEYVYKDRRRGYIALHDPSTGVIEKNPIRNIINKIESLQSKGRDEEEKAFFQKVYKELKNVHESRQGWVDITFGNDNTIERAMDVNGNGKGITSSLKSLSVFGTFHKGDSIGNLNFEGTLAPTYISQQGQRILKANESKAIQVNNIIAAYSLQRGEKVHDKLRIEKKNIKDIISPSGTIEARNLDDIFKFDPKVNVYEIDLADLGVGIKLNDAFYTTNSTKSSDAKYYGRRKPKEVTKIYIPSLQENYVDGKPVLSRTQKAVADFLNEIQQISNKKDDGTSINDMFDKLKAKYFGLFNAYDYELTDKGGMRVQIQSTKENPGTLRSKTQIVISPHRNKDGIIDNIAYGKYITQKQKDGSIKYMRATFVSPQSYEASGLDFKQLGTDILDYQLAEEKAQIKLLTDYANKKGILLEEENTLKGIQGKIKQSSLFEAYELGSDYMREIGVEQIISRDPIIRTESISVATGRTADGLSDGSVAMDALTAQALKADTDGDEGNIDFAASFFIDEDADGNKRFRVLPYDSEVRKELRAIAEDTSKADAKRIEKLENKVKAKEASNKNIFDIDALNKGYIEPTFSETKNFNHLTEPHMVRIKNAVYASKSIIGQTSNPNYFIKGGFAAYVAGEISADSVTASLMRKAGDIGSVVSEQTAIDYKLLKVTPTAEKEINKKLLDAIDMEDKMTALFKATREFKASASKPISVQNTAYYKLHTATSNIIEFLKPYDNVDVTSFTLKFQNRNFETIEGLNEIVGKILNGSGIEANLEDNTVYIEDYLRNIIKVFEDDHAAEFYSSILLRRSKGSVKTVNDISTMNEMLDKILEARNKTDLGPVYDVAARQFSDEFISKTVSIGGVDLDDNVMVYTDKFANNIEPGVYKVKNNAYDGNIRSISLIDSSTGKEQVFRGRTVFDVEDTLTKSGVNTVKEGQVDNVFDIAVSKHIERISNSIKQSADSTRTVLNDREAAISAISKGKELNARMKASVEFFNDYNMSNFEDLNNTLDSLDILGISVNRSEVLKKMNDAIKSKGTKSYQEQKRKVLMKDNAIVSMGVTSNKSYNDLMKRLESPGEIDFSKSKNLIENTHRIDIKKVIRSSDFLDTVDKTIEEFKQSGVELSTDAIRDIRLIGIHNAMQEIEKIDKEAFEILNKEFVKYQHNERFRKEVLGWDLEKALELITNKQENEAIKLLSDAKIIYGEGYSGRRVGELSTEVLLEIQNNFNTTGIDSEIIIRNNEIINELIKLREKHGIMLSETPAPNLDNVNDNMAKKMVDSMNESIMKRGKTRTKSSTINTSTSNVLDNFKNKISSITPKHKMMIGAAVATGIGATTLLGAHSAKSRAELKNKNENEQLIQARSSVAQAPPSDKRMYTSDNNAININVRGRSPFRGMVDGAERAIASLFGHNVSVNSNIQDSRREISDREVDEAMEKAIR